MRKYQNDDLYKPYISVAFGAYYLAEQLDAFDGKAHVALSAYNAGPGNAANWYALAPDDPDFYLEIISLSEPRSYIRRIYTYSEAVAYTMLEGFLDKRRRQRTAQSEAA